MPFPAAVALGLLVSFASAGESKTESSKSTTKPATSSSTSKPAASTTSKSSSSTSSTKTASNTATTKSSRPAPVAANTPHPSPKKVAPKVEAAPPAESDATMEATDHPPAGTTTIEVMAEVIALRADVVALQHLVEEQMRPPEPEPTPEEAAQQRERERADERLSALKEQRQRLDEAMAAGLDHAVAAPAIERLDAEIRAAQDARLAIDLPVVPTATVAPPAEPPVSLAFDLGVGSAYAFRGLNVFAARTAQDPNGVFSPALTANFGDSGFSVGYWGAYQLNGDNAAALVDVGLGAESDLIFGYTRKVSDKVTVGASATAYLYPFADADTAGTPAPLYVEPAASVVLSEGVDLGLQVTAMYGVQEALAASRYLYVHPTVGRTLELGAGFSLVGAVGGGAKVYFVADAPTDNVWDASADLALQKTIADAVYVRPSVHGVWTNEAGESFGDASFGWFGVNVGAAI